MEPAPGQLKSQMAWHQVDRGKQAVTWTRLIEQTDGTCTRLEENNRWHDTRLTGKTVIRLKNIDGIQFRLTGKKDDMAPD